MITVLVSPGELNPGAVVMLDRPEAHHLRVRRTRPGESVRLIDGKGLTAQGRLGESAAQVAVESVERIPAPASLGVAVGAGDRDRFAWLVEKSAELGVTDIIPLETERTAGVSNRVRGEHIDKLQRRALEAIKQSGAAWAPIVHLPHTLPELVARHHAGPRWLADAEGEPPQVLDPDSQLWITVGPEGGFTEAERALLKTEGWRPVRLGPHVLRFETAAVAAAAMAAAARRR